MRQKNFFAKILVVFLLFAFSANAQNNPAPAAQDQQAATQTDQIRQQVESFRHIATGFPVMGPMGDTLFLIYNKMGNYTAAQRAQQATANIKKLYDNEFIRLDSLRLFPEGDSIVNIVYKDMVIMGVNQADAMWFNETDTNFDLAKRNMEIIHASLQKAISDHRVSRTFIRIALTLLVFAGAAFIIWLLNKLYRKVLRLFASKKENILHDLKYKNYTFLNVKQLGSITAFFLNILRWLLIILFCYLILPIVFSIFPFTREWATVLFSLIWFPFKKIFLSIWHYIPNFVSMLVIYLVFRYLIKFIKYIFGEMASGKLRFSGFYPDWAMPTFHIIRILLWALAFVMIYTASPWAESRVFAGVSVFLGLLVSFGSSSAIANIVSGLVITYMRPFKEGDRIKFGDQVGDVIEKSILVTRLRTIKNEEITIPNSSILAANTINYSTFSQKEGLIIYATVTMDYSNDWKIIHAALIEAAERTGKILKSPKPFVLQLSLDEFYVSYQINGYIRDANSQAAIYSELYTNIQDVFKERGLDLLSPVYEVDYTNESRNPTNNTIVENKSLTDAEKK